jgi:hypothetical protein
MLHRWTSLVEDINLALKQLWVLAKRIIPPKRGRGAKPKHPVAKYAVLLVLKEFDKRSLRGAEVRLSELICKERVDHSVISYWENRLGMEVVIAKIVAVAGALLDKLLSTLFLVVDSTKFTSWKIQETEVTFCTRIAQGTVYPIGISFQKKTVDAPLQEAVPSGSGLAYLDAWYDVNEVFKLLFQKGYVPVICPNKNRIDGYWRRKGRKLYRMPEHRFGYRQRGRGESPFGSLTNAYGDRFKVTNKQAMKTRIASRTVSYQLRILLRVGSACLLLIVRHALPYFPVSSKLVALA